MNNQLCHITNHWALEKKHKKTSRHKFTLMTNRKKHKKPQGSSLLWWQFWHKPIFAGKKYFCQSGFYHGKNGFFHLLAKTCQPW